MLDEEKALLKAVALQPDDNLPRLIYADWLDDRGDKKADYIRFSIEIAKKQKEKQPISPAERSRLEALYDEHNKQLSNHLQGVWNIGFERGFPSNIETNAQHFLQYGKENFALSPIQFLYLRHENMSHAQAQEVANIPCLSKLKGLHMGMEMTNPTIRVREDQLDPIIASRHLSDLKELGIRRSEINDNTVSAIIGSMKHLEVLELQDCFIGNRGARAIAESASSLKLTVLSLRKNNIDMDGLRALAASPNLKNLTHLDLSDNLFALPDGLRVLANAQLKLDTHIVVGEFYGSFSNFQQWVHTDFPEPCTTVLTPQIQQNVSPARSPANPIQ